MAKKSTKKVKGTKIDEVIEKPKPEPKVETKPEPKVETKPEPKIEEPKPEPKVEKPKEIKPNKRKIAQQKRREAEKSKTITLNPDLKVQEEPKKSWGVKVGIGLGIAASFAAVAFIIYKALDERRKQKKELENETEETKTN